MKSRETPPDGDSQSAEVVGRIDEVEAPPGERDAAQVMASAMAAIEKLAELRRKKRQPVARPQTFEDVVCDLMRPKLQNWLDGAVPKLVEDLLRPELRRTLDGN